jgi:hypothetical protein
MGRKKMNNDIISEKMDNNSRKMSTTQFYIMLGKRDVEIEYLVNETKELLKKVQELERRNQELFDENVQLGGGISHATTG